MHFNVNFNVSFNIFLEHSSCAFSWINKRFGNIKKHGTTVKKKPRVKLIKYFVD